MKNNIKGARGLKILFTMAAIISCCFIYNSVSAVEKEVIDSACNELTAVDMVQLPPSNGIL
ncbi:MAG: hypothetical protein LBI41_04200 [Lactobacillales bacterium]|jgi:hypothetical protein|nr:hypothetical protein [Lactobacillales bacterium]